MDVQQNTAITNLDCGRNQLTSLDVSQNENLTSLSCYGNEYCIDTINGTFDLSRLPDGFDSAKASNWEHATVDGNTLILSDPRYYASYDYDLGNGATETFILEPTSCELTEDVVAAIPDQIYTGSEIEPKVSIQCGDTPLHEGDYTISYQNNIDVGTATAIITGEDFFHGTITVPFTILPADLTNAGIQLKETYFVYNGAEQSPIIERIISGSAVLTEDDYTITGNTATDSGTYTLTIHGKGNFTGEATAEWYIERAVPAVTPVIPDQAYTEGDDLPELGYKCSVDGIIMWITSLEQGLIEGENELEWRFVPDDRDW